MASCSKCGKNVGCACNLVNGVCLQCSALYSTTVVSNKPSGYSNIVQYSQPDAQPISGFDSIVMNPTLTQEEKVRRINEILEQARQQ